MREQQTPHFVGLDIGTSAVRCVVGTLDAGDPTRMTIIGYGKALNTGMRRGVIVHIDEVVEAASKAIEEAERMSGTSIHHACVNINGPHILGINSTGVIAISTANREITLDDRVRAEEAAAILQMPPNRKIIQIFPQNYSVDGQDNIKDPVGMQGVRLEVDTHIITAATPSLKSLEAVCERLHIVPSNITVSALAGVEAVLERQQKEAGTLLLDIGSGTTNLAVVEDGEIQYVGVLPIGSNLLTNDLAIGLKTDLEIAEQVKVKQATLEPNKNRYTKITHNNKIHNFEGEDITMITEARLDELFEYVEKELKTIHKSQKLPGGVVIVGGMSALPGIAEFAKDRLQLPAQVGSLQHVSGLVDSIDKKEYIAATGLAIVDMLTLPQNAYSTTPSQKTIRGVFEKLKGKIKY